MAEKEYIIKIPFGKKLDCSTNNFGQTTYTLVDDLPDCWSDVVEWHANQKDKSDTYKAYFEITSLPKDKMKIYKTILPTLKLRMVIESLQSIEEKSIHYGGLDKLYDDFNMYFIKCYDDNSINGMFLNSDGVLMQPYNGCVILPAPKWLMFYTEEMCRHLIKNFRYILFDYFEVSEDKEDEEDEEE